MPQVEVHEDPEHARYVAVADGEQVGFSAYTRAGDPGAETVTFTHTVVDPAHRGEGIGGALVRASLDDVRRRGLRVVPACPFYAAWFEQHPEAADLLVEPPPHGES